MYCKSSPNYSFVALTLLKQEKYYPFIIYSLTPVVKYLIKIKVMCALLHDTGNTAGLTGQCDFGMEYH